MLWENIEVNGRNVSYRKIKHGVNGNPRYIIPYYCIDRDYNKALSIFKRIGGKYRSNTYGLCFVLTSYALSEDLGRVVKGD